MKPVADLSVIMPTFNHARYLRRALDAILAQSMRPKEIIVIDDCSSDETPAILAEYQRQDAIVQVLRNEPNRGVNASVRRGLERATGGYVFFPGSDDQILPGFIEKSMELLGRHPEARLCCSHHSTLDGITGEIRDNPSHWCDEPRYFSAGEAEGLLGNGGIAGHTAIFKRSAVDAAGVYLPDLEWHADLFLGHVIAFRHGLCHVPEMLALLTVMPGTYSTTAERNERQMLVLNALLDRLLSRDYADVAPAFRRSGCLGALGPSLLRAAATRPDAWSKDVLGLLNCLLFADYDELKADADPAVRDLAALFLGPFKQDARRGFIQLIEHRDACIKKLERQCAEQHKVVLELCERIQGLDSTVEKANQQIANMQSSWFWKVRSLLVRCKRAIVGVFRPAKRNADVAD